MKPPSAHPGSGFRSTTRGDAAILYTFITLMIILLGSLVIAVLVIVTQQRARDITASAQAFYAANTGVERGFARYMWSSHDTGGVRTCEELDGHTGGPAVLVNDAGAAYTLVVSGNPWADPPTDCPTLEQINPPPLGPLPRGLCATSIGAVRGGTIQRRIESDTQINCR